MKMNIKPLYKSKESILLVGLEDDYRQVCVPDGLVVAIDLKNKKILHPPWSGQKILRQGDYSPIIPQEKNTYRQKIRKSLRKRKISDIEKQLQHPAEEAVDSLIWKPRRFRKNGVVKD